MNPILYGLAPFFGWALGDIFGAIASRKIGSFATTIWVFIMSFLLLTLYSPLIGTSQLISGFTWPLFILNITLGIFYVSGNFAVNEAFVRTNPTLVGTIIAAFPALVLVLSVIFFHDPITPAHIAIISIIFLGVFLSTFDFSILKSKIRVTDSGVLFALYGMLSFALVFTFLRVISDKIGWFWPLYIALLPGLLILIIMRRKKVIWINPRKTNVLVPILISAVTLRTGDIVFNSGLHTGLARIVVPFAGSYPVLFAILAFFIFKDPVKKQQLAGIFITLIGIVCLSLISS